MYFAIQVKKAVYMYTVNFLPEGHTAYYIGQTVHCTVYIIYLKAEQPVIGLTGAVFLFTVHCTLYIIYLKAEQPVIGLTGAVFLFTVHCTLFIIYLKNVQPVISAGLYTVHYLPEGRTACYRPDWSSLPVHCALYTVHCALCTVHCTLYTVYLKAVQPVIGRTGAVFLFTVPFHSHSTPAI